jgi:pimeloyl-ACP methyl ester carboxylesterase
MKIYLIPGLAADERVFRHLSLPPSFEAVHLKWIPPANNESLGDYALRLSSQINTNEPFALLGLSFGGMIAMEIAARFPVYQIILISSIPSPEHLPQYYKWAGQIGLHRILPITMIKKAALVKRYFTRESTEDKDMLRNMIRQSDARFIRWAIRAVLYWKYASVPQNIFHIHGTNDEILPLRYTHPTHLLRGGGHLMVMNRAKEINAILLEVLT